ncbi:pyrroline-5-carboxylate reductase [Actinomycetota bacterium]|nr:pyrroline-5-carboxylate reductase [Actinomycetota bacterium]
MSNQIDIAQKLGKIALIGGGKMGEAIIAGLVQGAMFDPEVIVIAEPGAERRQQLTEAYGTVCVANGAEISNPDTCILAVKPQVLKDIASDLAQTEGFNPKRVISIAAGISTQTLREIFQFAQIIRVMPNAPLMVGAGMSAVAVSAGTQKSEGELVVDLFSLMGEAVLVEENLINAATAISGSGPAYFALFVEHLTLAGINLGLTPEQSSSLAIQTFNGTARQLQLTDMTPAQLRMAVTSPKGTTAAALESFSRDDFAQIVQNAAQAALQRAEELA